MHSLADLRRDYTRAGLSEADLLTDPLAQFQRWFDEAQRAELAEPNAMSLTTVSADGQPSSRIVLLKHVDARGFTFFTNYEGQKGVEIAANPRVGLLFYWAELERQVRITGRANQVSREESESYFRRRPRLSRLAAWVSRQSTKIPGRAVLEAELQRLEARYPGEDIPLPPYWGGYLVTPHELEFWQGRPNRLHDRLRYRRDGDAPWRIERLAP
jgi:pyridoxamine 5'-phosphate oxidase